MQKIIKIILIITLIIYSRDTIISEMNKYKKIIVTEKNNSIILNIKNIEYIKINNGCTLASTQTIIYYVTGKKISQYKLAKETKYDKQYPQKGVSMKVAVAVLNNHLSFYLNEKQYIHKFFDNKFGTTIQQQLLFYNLIYSSLKNNFPVHFAFFGYWNKYYNNQFINHAVVLNGVEKADMIEDYTYHISDNNSPNTDMTFKSKDLYKLFDSHGEINYYPL